MEKIVITGGLGNIGIHLTRLLVQDGHEIIIYDYREDRNNIFEGEDQVQVVNGDIRDFDKIRRVLIGATGIIHLAAVSRVVWGFENPYDCIDINIKGTANVLEAARMSVRKPWIIFGSSREVYGEPDVLPCKESAPKKVANVYGVTKTTGENLLEQYCKNYGLSGIVLRFSNVYGSKYDQLDRVIPKFIIRASKGLPLYIQGGGQIFDFTHIDDTVEGIVKAVNLLITKSYENEGIFFDDFHILTGTPTSLQDLVAIIQEYFEDEIEVKYSPPRSYDVEKFYGDTTKINEVLNFYPKIDMKEGVRRMILELKDSFLGDKNKVKI